MNNLIAFTNTFLSYLLCFIVFGVLILLAIFISGFLAYISTDFVCAFLDDYSAFISVTLFIVVFGTCMFLCFWLGLSVAGFADQSLDFFVL